MSAIQPKYREAFHVLDIVQAKAAIERERPVCEFSNENGSPRGSLLVKVDNPELLEVEFDLFAEYCPSYAGRAFFSMILAPIRANPHRHLLICPSCNRQLVTLFFTGQWACGDCHRLGFRSRHVSREVLEGERRFGRWKELEQLLAHGRPHRMRQATYHRRERELKALRDWRKSGPRPRASERHAAVITADWISMAEAEQRCLIPRVAEAPPAPKPDIPLVGPIHMPPDEY